ncbi:MAG TPA: DinB family protein [Casimicrobiaceae bacterium]|jgi:uncharacterized damage-inducible protein DinB|nr:DinB family protein [Casimicrobiaceae bacterium]
MTTPTLARHFAAMAYNNAWSNHRLLAACAALPQADFVATRTSFFPSLKATLNHNLTVDWYYVDALERSLRDAPPNADFMRFYTPPEPYDDCASLARAQRDVDRRLIDLCVALSDADLARTITVPRRRGLTGHPAPRLLAHLFQHQIHHRGQAHAMLAGTSVAPPQLDEFFCTDDTPLHAADFEALGFTEAMVFGE